MNYLKQKAIDNLVFIVNLIAVTSAMGMTLFIIKHIEVLAEVINPFNGFYELAIDEQESLRPMIDTRYISKGYMYMAQYPVSPFGNTTFESANYSAPPRVMCPSREIIYIGEDAEQVSNRLKAYFAVCAPEIK